MVRTASLDDLSALLSLYRQLNLDDPAPDLAAARDLLAQILASAMMTIHVVEANGQVVATCTTIVVPNMTRELRPYAFIENVVSDSAVRGLGFGKQVIAAATEQAWRLGCYKVMLMTGRRDPAILRFYEACGFRRDKTAFQIRRRADPTDLV